MGRKFQGDTEIMPERVDTDRMHAAGGSDAAAKVRAPTMAASTDPGRVRELNEDAWNYESFSDEFTLCAVADGMGGHDRGEVASRLAIETLFDEARERYDSARKPSVQNLKRLLRTSFQKANHAVLECGRENDSNMGTTLTTTLIYRGTEALLANVGDTRIYLLRDGTLEQVTRDHSLVAYLVQMGELTREQARTHPSGNILVRSVGSTDDVDIDIFHVSLEAGDSMLLCTDGLWSELPDEEILRLLMDNPDPDQACEAMVERANEEGGKDNITCLVVTV